MTTKTKKAAKGVITDLVQYGVLIALQLVLAPLILTVAGPDVLGAYSIVMQVIGYGLILDFGLSVALNRYLSQSYSVNSEDRKFEKIFCVGRIFVLATNFLLFLFIMLLAANVETLIVGSPSILGDARNSLYMFAVWTILRSPLILYGNGLIASQNMSTANIIGLISGISRLIVSISLVYAGFGLIGLVLANILSELFGLILKKYFFVKLCVGVDLAWRLPDRDLLKELFKFGVTYWGVNVAIVLTVGSDSIVVGHLYGAAAAAIFYTTKIPSFLFIQAIFRISDNSGPAINELQSQGNIGAIRQAYLKILRYSLILAVPLSIGIVGFNKGVISAWVGEEQYAGSLMSAALALYVLTQVISHVNAMITVAAGKMQYWMTISVATGVITILLAYILGKNHGLQWVMVSIAIVEIPSALFLIHRSFGCMLMEYGRVWREAIVPTFYASVPLAIWVGVVTIADLEREFSGLVACIATYVLIWAVSSYVFGINSVERAFVRSKMNLV